MGETNKFGDFIEGNNKLGVFIANEILKGSLMYNPVFFYGTTGTGKTLLLKSIEKELRAKWPEKNIVYWDSELYVNTFLKNLRSQELGSLFDFKRKNRMADILIFDDFSFLISKSTSLQVFFQMLSELYMKDKMVIIAGNIPPKDMENIDERYRSRLSMGLVVGLEQPDHTTRVEILKMKAMERGISLKLEIMEYIAEHVDNTGALSGAINKLAMLDSQELNQLNEARVRELLDGIIITGKKKLDVQKVIYAVADYYKVDAELLIQKKRCRNLQKARQMAMYVAMQVVPNVTYKALETVFERDRSTIALGVKTIKKALVSEEGVQFDMQMILKKIEKKDYQ